MAVSLRTRLTLAFALVGFASVLTISVLVNFFMEWQFRQYAVRKQEERNREIVSLISAQYLGQGRLGRDSWKADVVQDIGVNVLEEGLILKLSDRGGWTVWDALEYNSGLCRAMIDRMSRHMLARYPSLEGGLTQKGYPILAGQEQVGTLQIGTYGPFYFSDTEFYFIDTLNRMLLWVSLGTLVLALASGMIISRRLSAPIAGVIASAGRIAAGDYGATVDASSSTREVKELVKAVNHLANTLGEQDRLRKRLTSDVAHELRTPLASVRGHLEAMIDGVWETSSRSLKGCHEEVLRIGRLVEDLATLGRYDRESLELEKSVFDLTELAHKAVSLLDGEFAKKSVQVSCVGAPAVVEADRNKITQVLTNLLSNGLAFTPGGGRVEVRIKELAETAELVVADTGIGIPPEDLPFIFERFYRVDKSRSRSSGGSGIGLAIVHEILRAHGGGIQARSEPGKGSEFIVTLPKSGGAV